MIKKKYAIPNFIIRTEIIYFLEKEKLDQFILGNSIKPIFISTEIPLYPFTNKSSMAHVGINVFFFFYFIRMKTASLSNVGRSNIDFRWAK
jgi:hypothetical protein